MPAGLIPFCRELRNLALQSGQSLGLKEKDRRSPQENLEPFLKLSQTFLTTTDFICLHYSTKKNITYS